jgi:hypothetical protein
MPAQEHRPGAPLTPTQASSDQLLSLHPNHPWHHQNPQSLHLQTTCISSLTTTLVPKAPCHGPDLHVFSVAILHTGGWCTPIPGKDPLWETGMIPYSTLIPGWAAGGAHPSPPLVSANPRPHGRDLHDTHTPCSLPPHPAVSFRTCCGLQTVPCMNMWSGWLSRLQTLESRVLPHSPQEKD